MTQHATRRTLLRAYTVLIGFALTTTFPTAARTRAYTFLPLPGSPSDCCYRVAFALVLVATPLRHSGLCLAD